jgi:hypothetical protein
MLKLSTYAKAKISLNQSPTFNQWLSQAVTSDQDQAFKPCQSQAVN